MNQPGRGRGGHGRGGRVQNERNQQRRRARRGRQIELPNWFIDPENEDPPQERPQREVNVAEFELPVDFFGDESDEEDGLRLPAWFLDPENEDNRPRQ